MRRLRRRPLPHPHAAAAAATGLGARAGLGGCRRGRAGSWRSAGREARAGGAGGGGVGAPRRAGGARAAAARWGQVPAWARRPSWVGARRATTARGRFGSGLFRGSLQLAADARPATVKLPNLGWAFSFKILFYFITSSCRRLRGGSRWCLENGSPHPSFLAVLSFASCSLARSCSHPREVFLKMKRRGVRLFLWAATITKYYSIACWIFYLKSSQAESKGLADCRHEYKSREGSKTCRRFHNTDWWLGHNCLFNHTHPHRK